MKELLLVMSLLVLSALVYSSDKLNSHEQFETGPMPKIISYDTEFRPPIPMPTLESGALPDDELYQSDTKYDISIKKVKD